MKETYTYNKSTRICLTVTVVLLTAILIPFSACSRQAGPPPEDETGKEIRPPVVAGKFYPEDPEELTRMVDALLQQAGKIPDSGKLLALIAPHASYAYSGKAAAASFKLLEGAGIDRVFLIGCSHRAHFTGVSIYGGDGCRTPLGVVPVDKETAAWMRSRDKRFGYYPEAHGQEHSLEVELPFLQRTLKDFKVVPILFGRADKDTVASLGRVLAEAMEREPGGVIVCSTDMTHYPPHKDANRIDRETLEAIKSLDPDKVASMMSKYGAASVPNLVCTLCGEDAVLAVMKAVKILGADRVEVLDYYNSGDVSFGDKAQVVGYGAVAFIKKEGKMAKLDNEGELSEESQKESLKIAREALATYIKTGKAAEIRSDNPQLREKRGVFVTLNKNGVLRGCMGHFEQDTPLFEIVARQAVVSATGDPRFPPVRPRELDDIDIEISVLSAPIAVDSFEDIIVGKHGVILQKGRQAATFLPQVAPEQGWDRETMLSHLAMKAGLSPSAWKEGCRFQVYTAQVFGEEE